MILSFEEKSDEEIIAIARDPNTSSEVLANLQQWLYKGGIAKIRLRTTYKSGLEIRFLIDEAIAENPNTNPSQLWGMLEDNSKNILNNPALPLLVLEHPTVFSHRNFSLLLDNIPKFILDVMLSNAKGDSEIIWEIQSHVGYTGEVQSDEDYTQGLRFLAKLPAEERWLSQLREDDAFPKFLLLSESDISTWSPKEVLLEVIRCFQKINRPQWDETLSKFREVKLDLSDSDRKDAAKVLNAHFKYLKSNALVSFLENICADFTNANYFNDDDDDEAVDDYQDSSILSRFSFALNPAVPQHGLEILCQDTNRYVRATAQAALEMRRG
jgi:hypothetical protein